MLEYLKWRGDLPFTASPLGEVDMLVLSQLSYLRLRDALGGEAAPLRAAAAAVEGVPLENGNAQLVAQRRALLAAAAASERFGSLWAMACEDVFDPAREMQFAAVTFALPGEAQVLAFRGTDATLVGWREDFNMSFACPVPAQTEALRYLSVVAAQTRGPLYLCGHSKGGNLALYAAALCAPQVRARIAGIYLFDAPGMNTETAASAGYAQALAAVRCYVPQTSMIGRLMRVPEAYTVVRSTAAGMAQHNVFTWALDGPRFATLPALDNASRLIKATLDDFLAGSTADTRRLFVETLFGVLGAAGVQTFGELAWRWSESASAVWGAVRGLDPQTRKAVLTVVGSLASSGMESAWRWFADGGKTPPKAQG